MQTGLGDNFYVGGYDVSGDVSQIPRIGGGPAAHPVTAISHRAVARIGGLFDASMSWSTYFNPSEGQAHERFSAIPGTDEVATYCRDTVLGNPGAALVGKRIIHSGSRTQDGGFTFEVEAQAAAGIGLEWGRQGTAGPRADTEPTDGDSIDDGAASEFGLSAYLHVFDLVGDDVTIAIEESADDGDADTWAAVTGGAFAEVTAAHTSERIATAPDLAVEQYLRVVSSGTFTSATFAVLLVRHEVEPKW